MSVSIHGNNVGLDENMDHQRGKLTNVTTQNPEKKNQSSQSKCLQLRFKSSLMPLVVYTGIPIGREDAPMEVVLVDALTGDIIKSGSEASAVLEILVLRKSFHKNDTDNWTSGEFEACILEGRHGKPSLLARTRVNLIEGCGCLNDFFFSHTKHPLPKTEVRLGARLIQGLGSSDGARIREAVSEPFTVKDRRGMNKNDHQLSWTDEVSWLKNIRKDGPSHKKLRTEGIEKVGDFLAKHSEDPQNLKNILGETMTPKKLEATINHAMTCEQDMRKRLPFSLIAGQNSSLVLKNIKEERDSFLEAKHDDPNVASNILQAQASDMGVTSVKNWIEDVSIGDGSSKSLLFANSDGTKIIKSTNAFDEPFNILGLESTSGAFCEDEFLWYCIDRDTITRAFSENEHQQFLDPFGPFQSSTFCSPADLQNVIKQGLLQVPDDVPSNKAQTQRGWTLLFSILRWFSIRRIVARKQCVRGILKGHGQEQMFSAQALNTTTAA